MKTHTKLIVLISAVAVGLMALLGRDKTYRWDEKVRLGDGTVVDTKRTEKFEVYGGSLFTVERSSKESTIVLPGPGNQSIVWRERIIPMVIEKGSGAVDWIVIGSPATCEQFDEYGRPKPAYVQFEHAKGQWKYRVVDPIYFDRPANLLMAGQRIETEKPVTVEEKRTWNSRGNGIAFSFLRILANEGISCYGGKNG
jgi:hypothetical protein